MDTVVTTVVPAATNEPIPGYILRQRLGSGGYGEVWEAEAPGGLKKAVKFVYGALEEARAQRELKSLNRIKEVHHPFLLSLERIEIVDGRLIIVTELADGCLRNRFDECRRQAHEGIPRDELLGYLRDAADALDFIHQKHQLQHLDIKPENLLLVGNHVKIADFGLLKDLREAASLMGGMTPLYCPPEVLDGRPGPHSDQYSLAIVYQELLTGQPPFAGRTTAQLAAQHLHSPPMLAVLPVSDQPAVLRALSKKPDQRFQSCRAFIEALIHPKSGETRKRTRSARKPAAGAVARTEALPGSGDSAQVAAGLVRLPVAIRNLPPLSISADEHKLRPTVVIGVGGAAGRVLGHLRGRLNDRFGDAADVPALQMLLLDTDSKALATAMFKRGSRTIPARNTLAIPLRSPKDYRSESRSILEWLSRRWLYNIPRSLQTEGLRPLGRLAFVDHSDQILSQLEKLITTAVSPQSLAASQSVSGLPFEAGPPRIFIVASVSGGTGSGAVVDMGYAVRKVLGDLNLPDAGVCGVLLHSTGLRAETLDLSVANTLAAVSEIFHFGAVGSCYPGDPACQLPPFYHRSAPFHETYLVHLGDGQKERAFDAANAAVADYLYENSVAPTASFFEKARDRGDAAGTPDSVAQGRLRTFGIARLSPFERDDDDAAGLPDEPAPKPGRRAKRGADDAEERERPLFRPANGEHDTCLNGGDTCDVVKENWWLERNWSRALPGLSDCGGGRRLCISAPAQLDRQALARCVADDGGDQATFIENDGRDIVVCHEIEDVPIENVVGRLIGHRHDLFEIASRIHTRIDVEWMSLAERCDSSADHAPPADEGSQRPA